MMIVSVDNKLKIIATVSVMYLVLSITYYISHHYHCQVYHKRITHIISFYLLYGAPH